MPVTILRWLAILSCTLVPAAFPPSVEAIEFIADQITRTDAHVYRSSLYHRDDMWRIEHNNPGSIEVTIVRKDKGLIWLLLGRMRRFATMPFDDSADVLLERRMVNETGRELIGTEILDGHPTTLSQITVRDGDLDVVYYQWWAEDLQIPLRLARQDGAWVIHYKNVRIRALSPRLFELPLHYQPVEP